MDNAAQILAAIMALPPVERLDALAIAVRAALDAGLLDEYPQRTELRAHQVSRLGQPAGADTTTPDPAVVGVVTDALDARFPGAYVTDNDAEAILAALEAAGYTLVGPAGARREAQSEVERLADALHERHAHPDFEYQMVICGRKASYAGMEPEGDGWVENITGGEPHSSWERFDYHDEHWYRRPKTGPWEATNAS